MNATTIQALLEQSHSLERGGRIAAALEAAEQALRQARAATDMEAVAASSARIALVLFRLGDHARARLLAEEVLALAAERSRARADAWLALGCCDAETDDLRSAEEHFTRAANLSRQIGHTRCLLRALHDLGAGIHFPRGRFDLAVAAEEEALQLARAEGHPDTICKALITLAWIAWLTCEAERAAALLADLDAVALPRSLDEGYGQWIRGNLALDAGHDDEAEQLYGLARAIATAVGEPGLNVLTRLGMSRLRRVAGNAAAAVEWADDALHLAQRAAYEHLQGMALTELGLVAWETGDLPRAAARLQEACRVLRPQGLEYDLAHAELALAALHRQCPGCAGDAPVDIAPDACWIAAGERIVARGYGHLLERERAMAFPLLAAHLGTEGRGAALAATLLTCVQRVPPPALQVDLLGRFAVRRGGRPIAGRAWQQRRAGELLRLLLTSPGRTLARDDVIEALWPDYPGDVLPLLHQATSALRRALESDLPGRFPSRYLDVDDGRIALRLPAGSRVDAEEFEASVRREEWEQALTLYVGEFLPDDRYAAWAALARERSSQLLQRALYGAAQRRLDAGRWAEALDVSRRILALDHWQERAAAIAMRASLALGDRPGAIALYLALERALHDDLGVAPQDDVRRLYLLALQS